MYTWSINVLLLVVDSLMICFKKFLGDSMNCSFSGGELGPIS